MKNVFLSLISIILGAVIVLVAVCFSIENNGLYGFSIELLFAVVLGVINTAIGVFTLLKKDSNGSVAFLFVLVIVIVAAIIFLKYNNSILPDEGKNVNKDETTDSICVEVTSDTTLSVEVINSPNQVVSQHITLNNAYNAIVISHAFNVIMSDTVNEPSVTIEAGLLNYLIFTIDGNTLEIGLSEKRQQYSSMPTILLPRNNDLNIIKIHGASHFLATEPLSSELENIELTGKSIFTGDIMMGDNLHVISTGASKLTSNIQQKSEGTLDVTLSSASDATICGNIDYININMEGASKLDASNLDALEIRGSIRGASKANVIFCRSINIEVSGSSRLIYGTIADGCNPSISIQSSNSSIINRIDN